ncbi:response regulator transcription factor [Bacillus sp. ISL-40]|uniref:response regulator transcription factor n=1 Tax=unclassified Bacillus (in: firmicutes) TaxID=185979 RepID=UPI001BEAC3AD|nr:MULTISPECIES: response regulator transcription factor [unclassified Bacillus (in: firmicutes)]MBT2700923.1 response regulator transcription factor [Bacillus sp. ISL-40]MBT2720551.1 response regulator transcription factor [Bacillus sp. ISL-46]MBT2742980.1 response regulator transcription factor [Bacillus sp. ISL-77]
MYKVLLVDDERIITEGMSKVINWESIGTNLIGTARNGIEAYSIIEQQQPDIVISDIKMPGMNGLELVAKVHSVFPEIRFILLSGFSEFDFAKQAMQYGVKHYLLKPCNENTIMDAVSEICEDFIQKQNREQFIQKMKGTLESVLPYAKEQLLKEFITNHYENKDLEHYQKLFNFDLNTPSVRLVLFQLEGNFEFEHMFALKNIAEHIFDSYIISCTVGETILFLIEDYCEYPKLHSQIEKIKKTFFQYYQIDSTVAISGTGKISNANKLYNEALDCLTYRFYLGEGGIITEKDIAYQTSADEIEFYYDDQTFCRLVKSGSWEDVNKDIQSFFNHLIDLRLDINITKSYVIQLFNAMIRLCESKKMNTYLTKLTLLLDIDTIQNLKTFFESVAQEITLSFFNQNNNKHSTIIKKVIETIEKYISNQNLSLHWVANEMLYMNADYLGKLFKKETGEKFSNYITRLRIELAINLIEKENDVKVFEIAEKIGYGENPQYFSQVFKKHTGYTPSEYKRESLQGL